MLSAALAACALQAPASSRFATRRAVVTALPLAASWAGAAHAGPGDVLFGWIPEVGCTSGDKNCEPVSCKPGLAAPCIAPTDQAALSAPAPPPQELSMAEKIRRRRAELEAEEAQKLMAEYAKNRANSAASVANDNFGRALQ